MRTVHEVSRLTGVSIRTLHYYDSIGLLKPSQTTAAGYRLYNEEALRRLQNILLFRELQFSLDEIGQILDSPNFDRKRALEQQIVLLKMKQEQLGRLIALAEQLKENGGKEKMAKRDFTAFDTKKMDEYARQAKQTWGKTEAYKEFEKKDAGRTAEQKNTVNVEFMELFAELGTLRMTDPADKKAQAAVERIRQYITDHYYTCTEEIFQSLGQMYAAGGEMTKNIDKMGGEGTALFASRAIQARIAKK